MKKNTKGGFNKPIFALRQALMLWVVGLCLKKASQKLGVEDKMASRPSFSLYEIDPCLVRWLWTAFNDCLYQSKKYSFRKDNVVFFQESQMCE